VRKKEKENERGRERVGGRERERSLWVSGGVAVCSLRVTTP